jgi:hypothetical protein
MGNDVHSPRCLVEVPSGPSRSEMVPFGRKLLKMVGDGRRWSEMIGRVREWTKIVRRVSMMSDMSAGDAEDSDTTEKCFEGNDVCLYSAMACRGPQWSGEAPQGSRRSHLVRRYPTLFLPLANDGGCTAPADVHVATSAGARGCGDDSCSLLRHFIHRCLPISGT